MGNDRSELPLQDGDDLRGMNLDVLSRIERGEPSSCAGETTLLGPCTNGLALNPCVFSGNNPFQPDGKFHSHPLHE